MGLISKNETFKKTTLINPFRLQTFHRTSSITKYTSKAFIAFVVTSPVSVWVCVILGVLKKKHGRSRGTWYLEEKSPILVEKYLSVVGI